MGKIKCISEDGRCTRHQWGEKPIEDSVLMFKCLRCEKLRNPLAGLKMFRPKKELDKSTSAEVLLKNGEEQ
jgi:hypothetical protein